MLRSLPCRASAQSRAMAELALAGAGGAVCHAAGFGELGGEHRDLEVELTSAASGLAMVGPNCMGVINAFDRVVMWGADGHFAAVDDDGIALISQSGRISLWSGQCRARLSDGVRSQPGKSGGNRCCRCD